MFHPLKRFPLRLLRVKLVPVLFCWRCLACDSFLSHLESMPFFSTTMMVRFGFSDHARSRRSRAITAIVDLPKPLPTGHSLFNPAPPVAQLLPVVFVRACHRSSKSLKPVVCLLHLPKMQLCIRR